MPILLLVLLLVLPASAQPCGLGGISVARDIQRALDGHDQLSARRIGVLDVVYEHIAQRLAYMEEEDFTPQDKALLQRWGYDPDPVHYQGRQGMSVMLFKPLPGTDVVPVVAFRGTEPTDLGDLLSDADLSIGRDQYLRNHDLIATLLDQVEGDVDIVGHSLGAALAQHAAVEHHHRVRNVVGFQAPGVSRAEADAFAKMADRPRVRLHLSAHDPVDNGGEAHLPGEIFEHTPRKSRNPLAAHTDLLLLSNRYRSLRDHAGLTVEMDVTLHGLDRLQAMDPKAPVSYQTRRHEPVLSTVAEGARRVVAEQVEAGEAVSRGFWWLLIGR